MTNNLQGFKGGVCPGVKEDGFDPKTHKFGMAYKNPKGRIVYPYFVFNMTDPITKGTEIYMGLCGRNEHGELSYYQLTRAPEHDLIPMSDVALLIDALNAISGDADRSQSERRLGFIADDALTAFNKKYKGE